MQKEPKQPSVSFEQAARIGSFELPDDFIRGLLARRLQKSDKVRETSDVKTFLDTAPPDASDIEFMTNNDEVVRFRDELTDLVASVGFALPPRHRPYIQSMRENFRAKLQEDKQRFRRYVQGREQGVPLKQNRAHPDFLDFHGFDIPVADGRHVDLLDGYTPSDIHANIQIQRQGGGRFVQWTSHSYLGGRVNGNKPELTRRIYLNPRTKDAVGIFREIITQANETGLSVKAKIFDRSSEANVMSAYDDQDASVRGVRGDVITLYAGKEEADALLAIAEDVYRERHDAFKGRKLSSVPVSIGEGIGVGDQPDAEGDVSLASHRADVLEQVAGEVRRTERDPVRQVKLFRSLWKVAASQENISQHNMAFNARR